MIPTMRRFIRLNKPLVGYIVLLLVGIIGLFVGLIPSVQKSIALFHDIQTLNDEVNRLQKKANMLASLDRGSLDTYSDVTLTAVPTDKSVSTVLSTIEGLAAKNGLVISDFSLEGVGSLATGSAKQTAKPEGNILTETISLQGELMQLRNFLSDSTRVRRLLRIKDFDLTAMPKSEKMTAKLVVEFFYLPYPASIGKPSDPLEPFSQKETETLEKLASYPLVYTPESAVTSPEGPSVIGEEPAVPAVADPFFSPSVRRFISNPTPSPIPTSYPSSSPSTTLGVTPTPELTPHSTPSPIPSE